MSLTIDPYQYQKIDIIDIYSDTISLFRTKLDEKHYIFLIVLLRFLSLEYIQIYIYSVVYFKQYESFNESIMDEEENTDRVIFYILFLLYFPFQNQYILTESFLINFLKLLDVDLYGNEYKYFIGRCVTKLYKIMKLDKNDLLYIKQLDQNYKNHLLNNDYTIFYFEKSDGTWNSFKNDIENQTKFDLSEYFSDVFFLQNKNIREKLNNLLEKLKDKKIGSIKIYKYRIITLFENYFYKHQIEKNPKYTNISCILNSIFCNHYLYEFLIKNVDNTEKSLFESLQSFKNNNYIYYMNHPDNANTNIVTDILKTSSEIIQAKFISYNDTQIKRMYNNYLDVSILNENQQFFLHSVYDRTNLEVYMIIIEDFFQEINEIDYAKVLFLNLKNKLTILYTDLRQYIFETNYEFVLFYFHFIWINDEYKIK